MDGLPFVPLLIDGQRVEAGGLPNRMLVSPATGEPVGEVAQADEARLTAALEASGRGFAVWSATPANDRAAILRRAAALLRERAAGLARLMTLEQGKPLVEARAEWGMAADCFEWAAEEGRRAYGRVLPPRAAGMTQIVHRLPIGPVAAFTPWNFPAFLPAQKLAPALAAGCSVVLKPASETPACAVALADILHEAGLPPGVLNVVHGPAARISAVLIGSPVIRKVSLTGSVEVGRTVAALAGQHLKKCTMELGGHAPVLVFADADVARIAPLAVTAKYRNAGQVCTSPTRFIVAAPVYDGFVRAFVDAARTVTVGDGLADGTRMGPLINARQVETMERFVADAEARGGRIALGGRRVGNTGHFFAPTVIEDVPDAALVMREEPFGPLAVMRRVDSVEAAIACANALPYGLAAYAFTHDTRTLHRLARSVETGMLALNHFQAGVIEAPFGGVKDSGFGAEGGTEGIDGYLQTKYVSNLVD